MSKTDIGLSQNAFDSKMTPRPSENVLETKTDLEYDNTRASHSRLYATLSRSLAPRYLLPSDVIGGCNSAEKNIVPTSSCSQKGLFLGHSTMD